MKRVVFSLLSLVLVLGLAGCSQTTSQTTKEPTAQEETPKEETPAEPVSEEKPVEETVEAPQTSNTQPAAVNGIVLQDDSYKSVYAYTSQDLATMSGLNLQATSSAELKTALSSASTWTYAGFDESTAGMIASAISQNGNKSDAILQKVMSGHVRGIKVIYIHNRGTTKVEIGSYD